jgi:hypothetical protein
MYETYDRDELYKKVWEKPLLRVAKEYGVSSVALGKTCQKLSVPVPGRGHWAKLAHGHEGAKKPPLPKLTEVPRIFRSPIAKKPEPPTGDVDFEKISQLLASGSLAPLSVEPTSRPHPLVRSTASALKYHSRKDDSGILVPHEPGGLDIRVSSGTLDRALNIMTQILILLERQGHKVLVSGDGHTLAVIDEVQVRFDIEEPVHKVVISKPRVANPTDRWDYDEIARREPGGKLVLSILAYTWGKYEQRKRWSDAKVQRLENMVGEIVAGLMRTAVALRRQDEERKREEADRERRAREHEQLRKHIEQEEKKLAHLNESVQGWHQAELIRRFISAYAERIPEWPIEKQDDSKNWMAWALEQADRMDPFVLEKPRSVLDRKQEVASRSYPFI